MYNNRQKLDFQNIISLDNIVWSNRHNYIHMFTLKLNIYDKLQHKFKKNKSDLKFNWDLLDPLWINGLRMDHISYNSSKYPMAKKGIQNTWE